MPYLLEAVGIEAEGIPAEQVDQAAREFGMPMGPLELADAVGLDICMSVAGKLLSESEGVSQGLSSQGGTRTARTKVRQGLLRLHRKEGIHGQNRCRSRNGP